MNSPKTLIRARVLQFAGIVIALLGLVGYWFSRDVAKAELTTEQRTLLNLEDNEFHASFLVAGLDIGYDRSKIQVTYAPVTGEAQYTYTGKRYADGVLTDTILYVNIQNSDVTMIAIPRDIYLPEWQTKINSMHHYKGAEGLKQSVENILGLPIDYYAIINTEIFANMVDALDGVNVYVPKLMQYRDVAGGLDIYFEEGMQHLNGEDATKFIRYRSTSRGDIDRLDNVKRLANALLARVKELNVRAVTKFPAMIDSFFTDVETNATPALVKELLPRISSLQITAGTLPIHLIEESNDLTFYPNEVNQFLAETFGGEAKTFATAPELKLLISNRSGTQGLEELYLQELVSLGLEKTNIITREAPQEGLPTYLLSNQTSWEDADYFKSLFQLSKQQIDRLPVIDGQNTDIELVLGADAANSMLVKNALNNIQAVLNP